MTALVLDDERLRAERSDRRTWKSRVTGLEEYAPGTQEPQPPRRQRTRPQTDEEDAEYKLALEASKHQEEEDRRKRESRHVDDDDDDLAKAIRLSKEEEERRRRELEDSNATSLFDDDPVQTPQPQYTGFNQGYEQGNAVDFFANPIDQNQMQLQGQQTGYMAFQNQPTGYQNGYNNGFTMQPTGFDPYGQQQQQQQQQFQPQPTGFNPYAQQQVQSPIQEQPTLQAGSNNPWATNNNTQPAGLNPMQTGSNNPFAQKQPQSSFNRPQAFKSQPMSTLSALPEQKTLATFNQPSPAQQFAQLPQQPTKELSEHEARLNALLAGGEGQDTFGNVGNLRIPAQHTAPGTFVNSAGAGLNRLTSDATGTNPFVKQQYTGMPNISYNQQMPAATGPAGMGMNGFGGQGFGGQGNNNNPFGARPGQQQGNSGGDLIQF